MTLPNVFSINGFCGVWWAGPQADVGRHLSANPVDRGIAAANWFPVGYASQEFPLSIGIHVGLAELKRLRAANPGPYMISAWSEGAIIATIYLKEQLAHGDPDFKGAVLFGNPYRYPGQWAPHDGGAPYGYTTKDPGGAGIGGPRNNWQAPDNVHNYAHPGDLYTCCDPGESGDDQRIIFDFVLTQWTGVLADLWTFAMRLTSDPASSLFQVIHAVMDAITFYAGHTAQHQNYQAGPAMNYLAGIAKTLGP